MAEFTEVAGEYKDLYTEYEKKRLRPLGIDFNNHPDEFIINTPEYKLYTYTMKPITISGELYIPSYMSNSYKNSIDKIKDIDPSGVFFADLDVTDVGEDKSIIDKMKNDVIKINNNALFNEKDKTFRFHKRYKKVKSYNPTQIDPNDVNTIGNLILKLINEVT